MTQIELSSEVDRADAATFLEALFGERHGIVVLAFARGPNYDNDRYGHSDWKDNQYYQWPAERERLLNEALAAQDADVYICPALRSVHSRKKGTAAPATWAWADVDQQWDDTLEALTAHPGFMVVASGSGSHVYARLEKPTTSPDELEGWNRRLKAYLGADVKWADNSLLRLVGTNWQKNVPHGDPAIQVVFRTRPQEGISDLASLLPTDPQTATQADRGAAQASLPLSQHPRWLTDLLAAPCSPHAVGSPDHSRSGRFFELVNALYEHGYTDDQIIDIASDHSPSVEKYSHVLIPSEVRRITEKQTLPRGSKATGRAAARSEHDRRSATSTPVPDTDSERVNPGGPDGWALSDLGNAERLVAWHGTYFRRVPVWDSWLAWDSCRWAIDNTGAVDRLAKLTVRSMYERLPALDKKEAVALLKWAQKSEQAGAISAMMFLARTEVGIPIDHDMLDTDEWSLNVANGALDLRTGKLRAHRQEDLCTKLSPVAYDPDARCPQWLAFLEHIFAGDLELIEFVRRAVGYSLTGNTSEQCLFLCHGPGRNGKSTFLKVISAVLGKDYAQQAPAEMLLTRKRDGANHDQARLRGARLVTAAETPEGRRLDENLVKQLTGQDEITARELYKSFFQFTPVLKLWIATNHKPDIKGTDLAIWRRIKLIPFSVTIAEAQVDPHLGEKLAAELPGVLAWALDGCISWQHGGLTSPVAVVAATTQYRADMDQIGRFIAECCEVGQHRAVKATDLFAAYRSWTVENGEPTVTHPKFRNQLVERSYTYLLRGSDSGSRNGNTWRGIGLPVSEQRRPPDDRF